LRTYALKAAEKVTNLSNELTRLSGFLQQELDYTEYNSVEQEWQAKEERLESAIHIINTLKPVNDASLSDWQGVIGEELDEQREEKREREEELRHVIGRTEAFLAAEVADIRHKQDTTEEMRCEIDSLRRDLRLMLSNLSGIPVPRTRVPKIRNRVELPFPSCGTVVKYSQRPKPKSTKGLKCSSCGARLISRCSQDKTHTLELWQPRLEKFPCPVCGAGCKLELDPLPGAISRGECPNCHGGVRIVRAGEGVRVYGTAESHPRLTEDIINLVREKLPEQPWPTGIHAKVACELQLSRRVVSEAIQELIRRGEFLAQIGGILYQAVKERPGAESTSK